MLKNKKLVKVVILSVIVIVLLVIIILNLTNSNNNHNKKPISWAQTVVIDPMIKYPVTDVIDGDTIKTKIDNHLITVRLLGINTPEVVDPRKPVECFGPEASKETKSLLNNQNIYIELNPNYERTDKYGRLLAYIWLATTTKEKLFINEYLIRQGYAREYTYNEKNPYEYQKQFKADELNAKKEGKGMWNNCFSNL